MWWLTNIVNKCFRIFQNKTLELEEAASTDIYDLIVDKTILEFVQMKNEQTEGLVLQLFGEGSIFTTYWDSN